MSIKKDLLFIALGTMLVSRVIFADEYTEYATTSGTPGNYTNPANVH